MSQTETLTQGPDAASARPGPPYMECVSTNEDAPSAADPRRMARRLEELLAQIAAEANPASRALFKDCLQSLLAFYGEGLARIIEHLQRDDAGHVFLDALANDSTVRELLLIHGLHPVPLETRLMGALEKVRPYLQSHGGNIEFLGLEGDVARIRLQGTCKSCPSSAVTLELAVRRAVEEACPDLLALELAET